MSTKLTRKSPRAGYEMLESRSLSLLYEMDSFQERILDRLVERLCSEGFAGIKRSQITFLAALDCDANHAANVARRLNISRQAVHKTVRELEAAGWLETFQNPNLQNQKAIHFTVEGERMVSFARRFFFDLDNELCAAIGDDTLRAIEALLNYSVKVD
ncbi:MarR family winged helix-turn-helix transcriptional regulator [Ruegeria sp. EL01]|jgi:DNA-binding MarR family transcriptional regulator|uniref:MarR family winged helix-turn-helix transcriptional regulator n=1 Tax=Ruegeria sp. EL01 TaxID=2107578 RepID=UPI0013C44B7A|nr:MarR family transcriptional regulator [Ruegeria sp. EL01]